jgi:hypothetical protein
VCVFARARFTILVSARSPHKNSKPTKILRSEEILPELTCKNAMLGLGARVRIMVKVSD